MRIYLKKLDKLLLKSFLGPFIMSFSIALFVLIMQMLWKYIDEIAGKGASLWVIAELLFYMSISLVPMALPIGVLIASVMVMGNLAEHYELSSMKSAGLPLLRIMRPLMWTCAGIALFSFVTANNLIPFSNLKFKTRLYDLRRQRPALSLEEGVFNDDFDKVAIRIGKKDKDNRGIHDVLIYDHGQRPNDATKTILAKSGEMYASADNRYLIMNLYDGKLYQPDLSVRNAHQRQPYIRTYFKSMTKAFDLSHFELQQTREELFKDNHSMLTVAQLRLALDSLDQRGADKRLSLVNYVTAYFHELDKRDTLGSVARAGRVMDYAGIRQEAGQDTMAAAPAPADSTKSRGLVPRQRQPGKAAAAEAVPRRVRPQSVKDLMLRDGVRMIDTLPAHFDDYFSAARRRVLYDRALAHARSIRSQADTTIRSLKATQESRILHLNELHNKFSFAFACFMFLFIGAPMGAIIRKGGFGYPILIAILFFMVFVIFMLTGRKLSEAMVLHPVVGTWLPNLVLLPVGIWLTLRAMNDAKAVNLDRYTAFFKKIFRKPPPAA